MRTHPGNADVLKIGIGVIGNLSADATGDYMDIIHKEGNRVVLCQYLGMVL